MDKLKTVAFITLGCKVNSYETDSLIEIFKNDGFEVVDFDKVSDIYVINTCTVTNLSSKKSRQMIRRAKRKNSNAIVAAIGCYSQEEPEILTEMSEVDILLGNNNKKELLKYIKKFNGNKINGVEDIEEANTVEDFLLTETYDKTRAFIRVQDGCNQFCSYCIIPYVRGRIRSRKIGAVINEVEKLSKNNYKEIVLTGIHVASFGKDLEKDVDLIDLINKINKIEGIERIRLSSIEPTFLTEKNIIRLSKIDKLAEHFHLSLQSGSDTVLERMNRKYTTNKYSDVVQLLRKYFNKPSITTDIIVAFPGETDKEFKETCEFVKKIGFSQVHVFKYSIREGTKAAEMKNQINGNIASDRSEILRTITNKLQKKYELDCINNEYKLLIESFDKDRKVLNGHTGNYLKVYISSDMDLTNKMLNVNLDFYSSDGRIFGSVKE